MNEIIKEGEEQVRGILWERGCCVFSGSHTAFVTNQRALTLIGNRGNPNLNGNFVFRVFKAQVEIT